MTIKELGKLGLLKSGADMPLKIFSPMSLGHILRDERKQRKMTQDEVGKLVGVNQATISSIENGNPGTRLDTLFRLLSALELELVVQSRQLSSGKSEGDTW